MNKKIMIIMVSIILAILVIFLLLKFNKNKSEKIGKNEQEKRTEEINFEDNSGKKYTSIYSEDNLVYEIYDENGRLIVSTPTESGVREFMENPEMMYVVNE